MSSSLLQCTLRRFGKYDEKAVSVCEALRLILGFSSMSTVGARLIFDSRLMFCVYWSWCEFQCARHFVSCSCVLGFSSMSSVGASLIFDSRFIPCVYWSWCEF